MGKAQGTKAGTRSRSNKAAWAPEPARRWGLADGLGLTALIALTLAWPAAGDPSAVTSLFVTVGALACLPFAWARWSSLTTAPGTTIVPVIAAFALLAWGIVSAIGSDAPWQVSVYGWLGRSDGLLTLLSVVALLTSAAMLTRAEIDRVVTWLLAAGGILVIEALAQLAGSSYPPGSNYDGVSAALGNPNFFAATSAILAVLAVGRALNSQRPHWQRWAALALALSLAASSYLSLSVQGPVALVIGLLAGAIAWSLQHRGKGRALALGLSGIAVVSGLIGFALVVFRIGPFAAVRAGETIGYREAYWEAAWRMMSGLPVFGSGPDGFSRYVAAFRTEGYLAAPGSQIRVSAAHDIPLQYGATFGVIGLLAWLTLMISAGVLLVRALLKGVEQVWLAVSLAGAWVAYLAQAMISIDAPGLKALGWLVTGLVIAMAANRPTPPRSEGWGWRPWAAAGLGLVAVLAWWPCIAATSSAVSQASAEGALADVTNPAVPCPVRQNMLVNLTGVVPLAQLAPVAMQALEVDPRCAAMPQLVTEIALEAGDLEGARKAADISVDTDPLAPGSWYALSLVLQAEGDQAGADQALEEAKRLAAIDPSDTLDQALATDPTAAPASP